MIRKIISIDEEKCNGCGLCAAACREGAIAIVGGKAQLVRDDYCDGLGNCLPVCPTDAIGFVEREAADFDEAAVKVNIAERSGGTAHTAGHAGGMAHMAGQAAGEAHTAGHAGDTAHTAGHAGGMSPAPDTLACGCPGTHSKAFDREAGRGAARNYLPTEAAPAVPTHLNQWPVQISLVPVNAPYFKNANLLVAADCAAYAFGNFHGDFMRNRITLIGCPKLDEEDYTLKLTEILKTNSIKSVTVARMEVPCCGGIEHAVTNALKNCGKMIPWQVAIISTDGKIV